MNQQDPIKHLTAQLAQLPGIGERTALRLTLHMLCGDREWMRTLSLALEEVAERVHECEECAALTADETRCSVCRSPSRDRQVICVVASVQDYMALESMGEYRGLYHVLHGLLAPIDGIGPADLRVKELFQRIQNAPELKEIIIATPPTIEGEATAFYIAEQVRALNIPVSRIASGVPVGGDLQFADRLTLARSLTLRRNW